MKPASLLPFVLLAVAFWLLVIRPSQRQRAAKAAIISSLGPGAQVVTSSGIRGTVIEIDDDDVLLEIAEGVHVHFVASAIAAVKSIPTEDDPADDPEDQGGTADEGGPDQHDVQQDRTEHSALTDSSDPSEPTT
jgi:preprotein translocase subunit YajC